MISIPRDCPRGRKDCISLSKIESDGAKSFFCCGENNGDMTEIPQDKYTLCFKGEHRDEMTCNDKRDLMHNASVIIQAMGAVQKDVADLEDWSPWDTDEPTP